MVFHYINSANYGNKRRNLMQIKILYYEVNLPLHKWIDFAGADYLTDNNDFSVIFFGAM